MKVKTNRFDSMSSYCIVYVHEGIVQRLPSTEGPYSLLSYRMLQH